MNLTRIDAPILEGYSRRWRDMDILTNLFQGLVLATIECAIIAAIMFRNWWLRGGVALLVLVGAFWSTWSFHTQSNELNRASVEPEVKEQGSSSPVQQSNAWVVTKDVLPVTNAVPIFLTKCVMHDDHGASAPKEQADPEKQNENERENANQRLHGTR